MTGALLALALVLGTPARPLDLDKAGIATWYGHRCPAGVSYLGRVDTCTPYVSKAKGGRGGELVMYAATGEAYHYPRNFTPPRVKVCARDSHKCVVVTVRDQCAGCRADGKGGRVIDLSPTAFIQLAPLGRGILDVTVQFWNEGGR